jgi:3-oxoacid CoA-transferase subunit B
MDVVNRVITELCVLDVTPRGFALHELAPAVTLEQVRESSEAEVHVFERKVVL